LQRRSDLLQASPTLEDRPKIKGMLNRGANLAISEEKEKEFQELGLEATYNGEEAIRRASVVIDCTPKATGLQNKEKYYNK
jgi:glyceraldehyde-3-phosphate dehydrogenase (NAD(P))